MGENSRSVSRAAARGAASHRSGTAGGPWRAAAVEELLTKSDKAQGLGRRRQLIYQASEIRDEGTDNDYRRLSLVRRNRTWLLPVLLAGIALLLVLVGPADVSLESSPTDDVGFLAAVATFGGLGACVSAMQSLAATGRQRLPEALLSTTLTLARPAVGAGAALGAYALVHAGYPDIALTEGYDALAIAFIAGFSERYVFRLVATGP